MEVSLKRGDTYWLTKGDYPKKGSNTTFMIVVISIKSGKAKISSLGILETNSRIRFDLEDVIIDFGWLEVRSDNIILHLD